MNIISAFKSGGERIMAAWKSILVIWFVTFLATAAVMSPVKGALNAGFGQSMITERLSNGIVAEVYTDLGPATAGIISAFRSGFLVMILVGFILNAFFTGGLFDFVRKEATGYSVRQFFSGCVRNFWSYAVILLISTLLIFFVVFLISFIPAQFIDAESDNVEKVVFRTVIISGAILILVMPVLLLVADYARAWKAANLNGSAFKALGYGFSLTFGNFLSSWLLMFIVMILNGLYLWFVASVLPGHSPSTGAGVFLLLIVSQLLFMVRMWLKFYRYSCVTALMEQTVRNEIVHQI